MESKKHVHIIGIAGVTMAPLAVLYKNLGWKVTGSDKAFFPPMSTHLEENDIVIMPGFKAEHLDPKPDLVIVMAFITKKNPELYYAIENNIPYKTYSEVLPELIEKENSIVVAGSRGKTTIAALVSWLLEEAGHNPSFMIGGIAKNFTSGMRKTDSIWSVMEGDEYPTSSWNKRSKFLDYNPRYLILTGVTWDHVDIFTTKEEYNDTYIALVKKMPKDGVIIANSEDENLKEILKHASAKVCWYVPEEPKFYVPVLLALAKEINIEESAVNRALETFKGIKRRQEVRYSGSDVVVIDDNAHSPEKVEGVLKIIRSEYPNASVITIYEPGSRNEIALNQEAYSECFKKSDYIFLPRISTMKRENANFGEELTNRYSKNYTHMRYIPNDADLIKEVQKTASGKKAVILFMSQKGFRGMIDEFISLLQSSETQESHHR